MKFYLDDKKRNFRWSLILFFIKCVCSGLEYAVIFPTLWEYLQSLGVQPDQIYWLGTLHHNL